MKEKGLVVTLAIAISVIAINLGSALYNVSAANTRDHVYTFDYCGDGADLATVTRSKGDYSSAYAKNTSDHCAHLISVAGYQTNTNTPPAISFTNCTANGSYIRVEKGTAKYLPNYVKEWGYKYAYLVVQPDMHGKCKVTGLWSPDSV